MCGGVGVLDLNWLSAFFNVDGIEINARADIIFVTTGATDGRMIFFLNSVYFSANNAYCEQNLHRLTHIAKFLHKMCNTHTHIAFKSTFWSIYFVTNLILLRIYVFLRTLLGPKIVVA